MVARKRSGIPYSTETLVRTLRCQGGDQVTQNADELTILLSSDELARRFAKTCGFDVGPFELASQDLDNGVITLRARNPGPIDEIQIVAVPPEEEWRRLMARDIDVIPVASGTDRAAFEGLSSVRTISLPSALMLTIVFDLRAKLFESKPVRRAIMHAVDRQAIARLVCPRGCDELDSSRDGETAAVADDVTLPPALELLLPDVEPCHTVAAHIQYTLARRGVDVTLKTVKPEQVEAALGRPFQLALLPGRIGDAQASWYRVGNFGHWQSTDFDAAMDAGDLGAARKVISRELPGFDVVAVGSFAAVDARLCGGQPKSASSWDWLADLHPCESGEQ